ncbi:MAG: hypothetical protein KAU35_04750 [candidate division Zixibacteria bacterium]|nr:hypothetical protein [candidate division Zixibacteria bacterium]
MTLRRVVFALILLGLTVALPCVSHGVDPARYSLCDVRVLYLFDDPRAIDWPTLYYLNDNFGCHIDLLSIETHTQFREITTEIADCEIFHHHYFVNRPDSLVIDSVMADLFCERRPDVVLLGKCGDNSWCRAFKTAILELPWDTDALFNIRKVYEIVEDGPGPGDSTGVVTLNARELSTRYRVRMDSEIPGLFHGYHSSDFAVGSLTRYRLLQSDLDSQATDADFLNGLSPISLAAHIERLFSDGPQRATYLKQASRFISEFNAAVLAVGGQRADHVIRGYRALLDLSTPPHRPPESALHATYRAYLQRLVARTEKVALRAAGIGWEGRISLRDSPHGPKVKATVALSVDGPREIELSSVMFHPHWDTAAVPLDTIVRVISPHQSYVREFLVDIDRSLLETARPDSLLFTTSLTYGLIPLVFSRYLLMREIPDMTVTFEPDFFFVPPVANLDIDRVVSSMAWNLVITKPRDFKGRVHLNLQTPRGVFAGAYRTDLTLYEGNTLKMVRVPFTLSKLLEPGIQYPTVSLSVDGQVASADTALMRIASCGVDDKRTVGFLPDSSGLLEDVLRMTDAAFRPLTDRGLLTADLQSYDVIIIGSGAIRAHPSLELIRDRFEDYLRRGGSLVILGQNYDWPQGIVPFALTPSMEQTSDEKIANPIPDAKVLSKPYDISVTKLRAAFGPRRRVAAAVVSPAEVVFQTGTGASLLSVSRLGEGQMIYCGLPLLPMISELDLQAIHLFANILNY